MTRKRTPRKPTGKMKVPRRLRVLELAPPDPNRRNRDPTIAQQKRELRAVLQASAESLSIDVEEWIRRGARKNPLAAVSAFTTMTEYVLPKLARVEQITKQAQMTKEEVEAQLVELGLDPQAVWDKLA